MATMGEHRGWTIRVSPQELRDGWKPVVEAWPPELGPRTHSGTLVPFVLLVATEDESIDAGMAAARRYIDRLTIVATPMRPHAQDRGDQAAVETAPGELVSRGRR